MSPKVLGCAAFREGEGVKTPGGQEEGASEGGDLFMSCIRRSIPTKEFNTGPTMQMTLSPSPCPPLAEEESHK